MINSQKLKAKIVENGLSQEAVATRLGMSTATFNYRVNNKIEFKGSEIKMLIEIFHLTADELISIFFASTVDSQSTN